MSKDTAVIYLVLARDRYEHLSIRRMTKNRPYLEPDEVTVRVRVTIPEEAFAPIDALLEVEAQDVIATNLEVEDEPEIEVTS